MPSPGQTNKHQKHLQTLDFVFPLTFSFFPIPWYHAIKASPPTSAFISILDGFSTIANDVLHFGIDPDHFGIDLGVIARQNLWIPAGRDEDGVDTAGQGGGKDVGDLEAHEERKCHDDRGIGSVVVVRGVGEEQIEIREESADITDEKGTEGENRANEAFLVVVSKAWLLGY